MAIDPAHLRQHLEQAAAAYGLDATLPAGRATPRAAAPPAPAAVPPIAERAIAERATDQRPIAERPSDRLPSDRLPVAEPPAATAGAPAARAGETAARAHERSGPEAAVAALAALRAEVLPCTRCKLHVGRRHTVFGEGNPRARVMFVGEAPGAVEDQTGRPFVGPAGQLLDRIISGAMGLQRSDVFIANINKCRPPDNREPQPDEVAACLPYLQQQVAIVQPEVIVCLGRTAAQNLLGTTLSTTALRGRELRYRDVPVVVTWHPAYLLRDPSHKRETWDDIKRVNRLLGLPDVPGGAASG